MTEEDAVWRSWRARWERFQGAYVPHREQQLGLLGQYMSLARGPGPLRVLDLCSGPGSVADHVLEEIPDAEVVAVDIDPWLVELGRRTGIHGGRIAWVEADVRDERWLDAFAHRAFHGVLMATAAHWFEPCEIERIYRDVATVLVRGGVFMICDTAPVGTDEVRRLARAAGSRWRAWETAKPDTDDWPVFWQNARDVPEFRDLLEERQRRLGPPRPFLAKSFEFHQAALARARFHELGEVWRCHENVILLALR